MKSITIVAGMLLILASFYPAEAEEFELDYCLTGMLRDAPYVRGQYLEALESPPEGLLGVPEAKGGKTWYIQTQFGNGKNSAFNMVVIHDDAKRKVELWIDTNRDGDLSDEEALIPRAIARGGRVTFPPADLSISVEGKYLPYQVEVSTDLSDDDPYFSLQSLCCRRGKVTVMGEEYDIALFDGNANGLFNDTDWYTDSLCMGGNLEKSGNRFKSTSVKAVIMENIWHLFEPDPGGTSIRYKGPAKNRVPLKTNFKKCSLEFTSPETGTLEVFANQDGELLLPPGDYQWLLYDGTHRDDQGRKWRFSSGTVMRKPFTVSEDGENYLELCLPLRQQIKAITKGDTVTFDEQIVGRDGENVYVYTPRGSLPSSSLLVSNESLPPPSFTVLDPDGNEVGKGTFESG